ncbi:MAG: hypothetical protein IPI51_01395 [Betaproteobacteria bacterium]|nr:hypothetical protein [Betaproteobacteria bacterium]
MRIAGQRRGVQLAADAHRLTRLAILAGLIEPQRAVFVAEAVERCGGLFGRFLSFSTRCGNPRILA